MGSVCCGDDCCVVCFGDLNSSKIDIIGSGVDKNVIICFDVSMEDEGVVVGGGCYE